MPDRVVFHPHDASPRHLEDANALLRGRFQFAGKSVEISDASIFDKPPPSEAWVKSLHGFEWLAPLSAAGGEPARRLATNLTAQWLKRYPRYAEPAWLPEVMASRLINIFAHGRFVLANSDVLWRSKLLMSLREQSRMLARIATDSPDGLPRFKAAAAYALSGACLNDSPQRLNAGLAMLQAEIARQILPDGGHASRSPEALLRAHNLLLMVSDAMMAIAHETPIAIRNAHDRTAPMLRFFRLGDGALATFNGGRAGDAKMIEGTLARDTVRGKPFTFAPHSGYHRLTAGRGILVVDCGTVPAGVFANNVHAGCLSFEFSAGNHRVIVNCGAPASWQKQWGSSLRATAAHSTITLADTSMAKILSGSAARLLGPRLLGGPTTVQSNRRETPQGFLIESSHNGYEPQFGIIHERRLSLSSDGSRLGGADRLMRTTQSRRAVPFTARFHIHPDVRVTPNQGGGFLLRVPGGGEGWRFQAAGGEVVVEESIYFGDNSARKSEQLVISGTMGPEPVELDWSLERIAVG